MKDSNRDVKRREKKKHRLYILPKGMEGRFILLVDGVGMNFQ